MWRFTKGAGICAFVLLAAWTGVAGMQPAPAAPDYEGGQRLAATMRGLRATQDTNWSGLLKISGRNHKTIAIPISCQWKTGETEWSVTYQTGATDSIPAESLKIIFSTNSPPEYWYAKAPSPGAPLGPAQKLTGDEANIPLAGSDFWLSDLGFQFYYWPGQDVQSPVLRRGRSCYLLECNTTNTPAGGYKLVKVWIDHENLVPLEAEAYGADGRMLKDFELGSVTKIAGQYELKDMKISNDQTGSRTQIEFDLRAAYAVQNPP